MSTREFRTDHRSRQSGRPRRDYSHCMVPVALFAVACSSPSPSPSPMTQSASSTTPSTPSTTAPPPERQAQQKPAAAPTRWESRSAGLPADSRGAGMGVSSRPRRSTKPKRKPNVAIPPGKPPIKPPIKAPGIEALAADGETLLASLRYQEGVFYSRDGGLTWSPSSGLPRSSVGYVPTTALAISGQTAWALSPSGCGARALRHSSDGGASFTYKGELPCTGTR